MFEYLFWLNNPSLSPNKQTSNKNIKTRYAQYHFTKIICSFFLVNIAIKMQKGIVNMIDDKKILREFLHLSKTACYNTTTGKEIFVKNDTKFCDVIFDGLLCWAAAPAGSLATQFCPNKFIKSTDQVSLHNHNFCVNPYRPWRHIFYFAAHHIQFSVALSKHYRSYIICKR